MAHTTAMPLRNPWVRASTQFRWLTAGLLVAAAIPLALLLLTSPSTRAQALLAGTAYLLLTCVVLLANGERQRRAMPTRRTGHRLMSVGLALIFGLSTLGFLVVAVDGHETAGWVYDVSLLLGVVPLAMGLVALCWPPGTTRREMWLIAGDAVTSGIALLVMWVLVVVPADPPTATTSVITRAADLAPWAQLLAILAMIVVAAASVRPGALPIRQIVLLQLSVLVYVNADLYQHFLGISDERLNTVGVVAGAWVTALLYRQFAQRPALEQEDAHAIATRTVWTVILPAAVLVSMSVVVASYRAVSGPLPTVAVSLTVATLVIVSVVGAAQRILLAHDVGEMRMAKVRASLQESGKSQWFTALLGKAKDMVLVVDRTGHIVFQTPSAQALYGYSPTALTGRHVTDLFPGVSESLLDRWLQESLHQRSDEVREVVLLDAYGQRRETETIIIPLRAGASDGYVVTVRDVTDRLRLLAELAESGQRDALTGLTNREGFLMRLQQHLAAQGTDVALALIDVVGFRTINDSRGHAVGDAVLRAVAGAIERLPPSVAVAGRIGADEFAIVLTSYGASADREIGQIDRLLRESLNGLILEDGTVLDVAFCLGYVTRLPTNESVAGLIERADLALAAARSTGSRGPVKYESGMRSALVTRLRQEADLRQALEGDRVVVHYQPIMDLPSGRLAGVEALVRLRDPDGGLIGPDAFISQAEELGLIDQLGLLVLEQALSDHSLLTSAVGRDISVAVNISAAQITPELPPLIGRCLHERGVAGSSLTLEVTESSLVQHAESAAILGGLRAMGCSIAVDDFGTGYSSLSYLVGLPVDELKIDRSFVSRLADSQRSLSLVRVLLQMASTLGLTVVAEGVETIEQADLLRGMGCQSVQGYLYSRPLPLAQLLELVSGPSDTFHATR